LFYYGSFSFILNGNLQGFYTLLRFKVRFFKAKLPSKPKNFFLLQSCELTVAVTEKLSVAYPMFQVSCIDCFLTVDKDFSIDFGFKHHHCVFERAANDAVTFLDSAQEVRKARYHNYPRTACFQKWT